MFLVVVCTCVQVMASVPDDPGPFSKASLLEVAFKIALL